MSKINWNSVEGLPLSEAEGDFLAAVQTNKGWWVRLCSLDIDCGLVVVNDEDTQPAGWGVSDVTHWAEVTLPEAAQNNEL